MHKRKDHGTDIKTATEKRKIEEVIDISLRDYENEEKESRIGGKNIIVFGLPESEKTIPEERKEDDVKKMVGLCKNICKIKFNENDISKIIRLGKVTEDKERPLLITISEEIKKREIFRNLNKIRDAGSPFNKVTITHDMTKNMFYLSNSVITRALRNWSIYQTPPPTGLSHVV